MAGTEYQFEDMVKILVGEQYYDQRKALGLKDKDAEHDRIPQHDIVFVKWQEVYEYASAKPTVKKNVIYQVFASPFFTQITSHCAAMSSKHRPIATVKDIDHVVFKRSLLQEEDRYLNVIAIINEQN